MANNYIYFNIAWLDVLESLTMQQRGELTTALYYLVTGKEFYTDDFVVNMLVKVCGAEVMQNIENYREKCEKLKKNASKKTIAANAPIETIDTKEINKEEKKDGRIERRTEGLLSNPSGLERTADSPPVGGSPQRQETEAEYNMRLRREALERKRKGSG